MEVSSSDTLAEISQHVFHPQVPAHFTGWAALLFFFEITLPNFNAMGVKTSPVRAAHKLMLCMLA